MFIPTKKMLENVPFQLVYEEGLGELNQKKALAKYSTWILPQALAYVGKWKAVKVDGKYSGVDTIKNGIANCNLGSEWAKGLIMYLISSPRGVILPINLKASSPELISYSALVPLFLAAFKKFQDIPYSDWTNISSAIDKDLYAAMTCEVPSFNTEELISLREAGSLVKSGKTEGQQKNPISVSTLSTTGTPEFDSLPRLAKIMLTQTWVAHPSLRNKYMILAPNNWDSMPEPLINVEVVSTTSKLDWDL
jgi:hypothetical protein